ENFIHQTLKRRRLPEDIDHVDRLGNVGEPRIDVLAEDVLPRLAGIDRDDAVAGGEEESHDPVARPLALRARADDGDRPRLAEDLADEAVVLIAERYHITV